MKDIRLKELTLTNFKGEKSRRVVFNAQTFVYGDNGTGKSRLFNAFLWLLFGKDQKDRKDYMIRTVDHEGKPLYKCECSVSGILTVEGKSINLKRVYKDNWVKPRGQADEVLKGNITECYIDDTPVKVTDYQAAVNDIIDETVFKMITNPNFFITMPWQQQREQLFLMAGTVTDEQIAEGNDDYKALLDEISGKGLNNFRKNLASRKRKLKEELSQYEPKIEQTQKMCPQGRDFAAVRLKISQIEEQINVLDKQLTSENARIESYNKALADKQSEIEQKKRQSREILLSKQAEEDERCIKANAEIRQKTLLLQGKESEITALNREMYNCQAEQKNLKEEIAKIDKRLELLRTEYSDTYKQADSEDNHCPVCHQVLPQEMINDKAAAFLQAKQERLKVINDKGQALNNDKAAKQGQLLSLQSREQELKKQQEVLQGEADKIKDYLFDSKEEKPKMLSIYDVEQCVVIAEQVKAMESECAQMPRVDDSNIIADMQAQRIALSKQRDEQLIILAEQKKIEQANKEIEYLNEQAKSTAQQIADIEKQEYVSKSFLEKKIALSEEKINALFTHVTFRLFDYTLDGNAVECCSPMVGGVDVYAANTASQINAGLDIINTLSHYYQVHAPIFIDNRESVNNIISTQAQVINLVVSNDENLVIK